MRIPPLPRVAFASLCRACSAPAPYTHQAGGEHTRSGLRTSEPPAGEKSSSESRPETGGAHPRKVPPARSPDCQESVASYAANKHPGKRQEETHNRPNAKTGKTDQGKQASKVRIFFAQLLLSHAIFPYFWAHGHPKGKASRKGAMPDRGTDRSHTL